MSTLFQEKVPIQAAVRASLIPAGVSAIISSVSSKMAVITYCRPKGNQSLSRSCKCTNRLRALD
eukprot:2876069-Karenia_brevis.AAC.1